MRDLVGLAVPELPQCGEQAGAAGIQVIEIIAIDALDPEPVGRMGACVTHADGRGRHELRPIMTRPGRLALAGGR